jgi:hypothetical protein
MTAKHHDILRKWAFFFAPLLLSPLPLLANTAPALDAVGNKSVPAKSTLVFVTHATDLEEETLEFSASDAALALAPEIGSAGQPKHRAVPVGTVATFRVQPAGTRPVFYQWKRNGIDLAGADEEELHIQTVTPDIGASIQITVRVSNAKGAVTSEPARLTVRAADGSSIGGACDPVGPKGNTVANVSAPLHLRKIAGQTGWFASPVVIDLNGDGARELIAGYYTLYVYDDEGSLISQATGNGSRIYAPFVVADLDGDGITEIVCGQGKHVYAYEWKQNLLQLKAGWPFDTTCGTSAPEVRGLAAGDLDGNGTTEVVAVTTQTLATSSGGSQVYVIRSDGTLHQPDGLPYPAWPRYNNRTGTGGDADRNGQGHGGYGCFGLNVGIGNVDGSPDLEVLATYDNHMIQAFKHHGLALDASPYYSNRSQSYLGQRLTWGQFIRWADPVVEENHYHLHTGNWPNPGNGQEWLQLTASPPGFGDLDADGHLEVITIPNIEKDIPYVTQAFGIQVLQGAFGDGSRSARRLPGWEVLPMGSSPVTVDGWYPPMGVPAPVIANIQSDARPEIITSLNDGFMYAYSPEAERLWRFNYRAGKTILFASEPVIADLNQDGSPEVLFTTYGDPNVHDSGRLIILEADGALLFDTPLPNPGHNGNGNGAPAAPTVADLDGDGQLEVFVQTFDHGMDVFTIPGSSTNFMPWSQARGGTLRMGQAN